jgi:hypothetical protein
MAMRHVGPLHDVDDLGLAAREERRDIISAKNQDVIVGHERSS